MTSDVRIVFYAAGDPQQHSMADRILTAHFGGSTRIDSWGSWKDSETGKIETESSFRFETITSESQIVFAPIVAESLRKLYDQTEVLYSIDAVKIGRVRA